MGCTYFSKGCTQCFIMYLFTCVQNRSNELLIHCKYDVFIYLMFLFLNMMSPFLLRNVPKVLGFGMGVRRLQKQLETYKNEGSCPK